MACMHWLSVCLAFAQILLVSSMAKQTYIVHMKPQNKPSPFATHQHWYSTLSSNPSLGPSPPFFTLTPTHSMALLPHSTPAKSTLFADPIQFLVFTEIPSIPFTPLAPPNSLASIPSTTTTFSSSNKLVTTL